MTAINVVVAPEAIYIFTDGVGVGPDGIILGFQNKVHIFPHLNACMAIRGTFGHSRRIGLALAEACESFDTLVELAPHLAVEATANIESPHGRGFDLVLGGWSESRRAMEVYQMSYAGEPQEADWTGVRITSLLTPYDDQIEKRLRTAGIAPGKAMPPIREFGLRVTGAQRAVASATRTGETLRTVGGFCQMTVVRRDGISVKVIKQWPEDRIGGQIGG